MCKVVISCLTIRGINSDQLLGVRQTLECRQCCGCVHSDRSKASRMQKITMECALLVVIVALLFHQVPALSDSIIVRTAQGKVRGTMMESYTGKSFFAFRGVRYAESPTGDYRFKVPS